MNTKISVIVPAYNAEITISKCIISLLNQDFNQRYEIIVVDNGSTDQTVNILKSIKDEKIRILSESKKGPASARNRGILSARGDFLAFTDSDCEVEPDWLQKIMKTFNKIDADVVGGGVYCPYINLVSLAAEISMFGEFISSKSNFSRFTRLIPTNNICYRKEIFNKYGLFDEKFRFAGGEDALFNWKIYRYDAKIYYNNEIRVIHHHKSKLKDFLRKKKTYGQGFYISRNLDKSMPYSFLNKSSLFIPCIFTGKMAKDLLIVVKNHKILYKFPFLILLLILGNIFFCMGIVKEKYFMDL